MNLKNEIWKDIKNFEGLYQVSNLGRVRSLNKFVRHSNHFMKLKGSILKLQTDCQTHYKKIRLCKEGKYTHYAIHRLVAQTFIPNPDNLPQVNHKDENKSNNCVDNLEWCDSNYNNNYGTKNRRVALKLSKPILQYDLNGNFIKEWISAMEIQRQLGYANTNINACCNKRIKRVYGYIWRFK